MKHLLLVSLILLSSCHSTTSKKGQDNEADSILLQEELHPDSIFKSEPIPTEEEQGQSSGTTAFVLQPVPRDIPTGEAISPVLLSMKARFHGRRTVPLPHRHAVVDKRPLRHATPIRGLHLAYGGAARIRSGERAEIVQADRHRSGFVHGFEVKFIVDMQYEVSGTGVHLA